LNVTIKNTVLDDEPQRTSTQIQSTARSGMKRRQVSRSPSPSRNRRLKSVKNDSSDSLPSLSRSPSPDVRSRSLSLSRSPSPQVANSLSAHVPATQQYKDAIDSVRKHAFSTVFQTLPPTARSTNIKYVDENMDGWLEDDVGTEKKKRKSLSDLAVKENKTKHLSINRVNHHSSSGSNSCITSKLSKSKKTFQPSVDELFDCQPKTVNPFRSSTPIQVPASNVQEVVTLDQCPSYPTTRVKVLIAGEMFLIPVPSPNASIRWLAEEASARYYRQVGSEPVLRLVTGDGAALDPGDLVSHVVQGTDPLKTVIMSWNCKPAEERYRDSCKDLDRPIFKNISAKLSEMATTNSLTINVPLKKLHAEPIFHCLKSNVNLRELDLSNCQLASIELLQPLLPSLLSLSVLNLSQNLLSLQSLKLLSELKLSSLTHLVLAANPLGDLALPYLTSLLSIGPLVHLNINRCHFTKNLFQSGRPEFKTALNSSKTIRSVDVSYNLFGEVGLEMLLKCLPTTITSLNLNSCIVASAPLLLGDHLLGYCNLGNPNCDLISLDLSGLCISDIILKSILSCLAYCGRLTSLSLAHNPITVSGLISIIESLLTNSIPLTSLNCSQLPSMFSIFWSEKLQVTELEDRLDTILRSNCSRLENLSFPESKNATIGIKKIWDSYWGTRSQHSRDDCGNIVLRLS